MTKEESLEILQEYIRKVENIKTEKEIDKLKVLYEKHCGLSDEKIENNHVGTYKCISKINNRTINQ